MKEGKIVSLKRNFMFVQVFYYHDGIKRLEHFISDYLDIPYEKVKGNLTLLPRDQQKDNKFSADTQIDLLLKYDNITVNIEVNTSYGEGIKKRNLVFLSRVMAQNYKKGEKDYHNIGASLQINLNYLKNSKQDKLVHRYRLYEEDFEKIFSPNFQIDEVDMRKADMLQYKCKSEWEKKIYSWCKLFIAEDRKTFDEALEEIEMTEKEREDFSKIMEEISSEENIIRMETDLPEDEVIRNTIIYDAKVEARQEAKQEEKEETAKNMLKDGLSKETISKYTNLSLEEITQLEEEM